jgi:hypothetical protein
MTDLCSCGEAKAHIIAKRRTYDNVGVMMWSDGSVTTWDGRYILRKPLTVGQMSDLMGKVELYDYSELKPLIRTIRAKA